MSKYRILKENIDGVIRATIVHEGDPGFKDVDPETEQEVPEVTDFVEDLPDASLVEDTKRKGKK